MDKTFKICFDVQNVHCIYNIKEKLPPSKKINKTQNWMPSPPKEADAER